MSFAVEVPGEAAPLSLLELARALDAANNSTNGAQRQSAGKQLQAWEAHPDYYPSLQVHTLLTLWAATCCLSQVVLLS